MPELPEVENVLRRLRPAIVGRTVNAVSMSGHRNYGPLDGLEGSAVRAMARRGKWIVAELDSGRDLLLHLGMTGVLLLDPDLQLCDRHVKLAVTFDDGTRLVLRDPRGFGRARTVTHGDVSQIPNLRHMGVEPLPGLDVAAVAGRLSAARGPVKGRLLGGRILAGIGNYLADEALWLARVHPASTRLSPAKAAALVDVLVELIQRSIAAGGSTLRDYRLPDGSAGSSQHLLSCYGRAGLPCVRCATVLIHTVVAGRGTTLCRRCQRLTH